MTRRQRLISTRALVAINFRLPWWVRDYDGKDFNEIFPLVAQPRVCVKSRFLSCIFFGLGISRGGRWYCRMPELFADHQSHLWQGKDERSLMTIAKYALTITYLTSYSICIFGVHDVKNTKFGINPWLTLGCIDSLSQFYSLEHKLVCLYYSNFHWQCSYLRTEISNVRTFDSSS